MIILKVLLINNVPMTKEQIEEMIERQDIYEIEYEKDQKKRIRHISNIEYSDKYDGKCILVFCHESQSDLVFNIHKICFAKKYWVVILTKDARAPKDGVYLRDCLEMSRKFLTYLTN